MAACLIALAFMLDLLLGDPRWLPHPVKFIALLSCRLEKITRTRLSSLHAGFITASMTIMITALAASAVLAAALFLHKICLYMMAVIFLYTCIAARDLVQHSKNVYTALRPKPDIGRAASQLGMMVGRDTAEMNEEKIITAAVESVAENVVDGVTAPLFWVSLSAACASQPITAVFLAVIGGLLYKAVNTMDSLFGYKNDRYRQFGKTAARLDDAANFIPARITGLVIVAAAFICRADGRGAMQVLVRDRKNHSSPNAGHPEAAFAGALAMRFGGPASYGGQEVDKPYIGSKSQPITAEKILQANRLALVTAIIFVWFCLLLTGYRFLFIR
ncbi:MAG: cobalamin biosynthesis protein CobD [Deltaproteobacteria bacterium]|nr:MAG: cobalamin biosynthesis protein CobD [Deltaproteobacteria bacterium]